MGQEDMGSKLLLAMNLLGMPVPVPWPYFPKDEDIIKVKW